MKRAIPSTPNDHVARLARRWKAEAIHWKTHMVNVDSAGQMANIADLEISRVVVADKVLPEQWKIRAGEEGLRVICLGNRFGFASAI